MKISLDKEESKLIKPQEITYSQFWQQMPIKKPLISIRQDASAVVIDAYSFTELFSSSLAVLLHVPIHMMIGRCPSIMKVNGASLCQLYLFYFPYWLIAPNGAKQLLC